MSYNVAQLKRDLANEDVELYMSGNHWGKSAWEFLYNSALGNKGSKLEIQNFLLHLGPILPCDVCRTHYQNYISQTALPSDNLSMFLWLETLENTINMKKYGKNYRPSNRISRIQRNLMEITEKVVVTQSGKRTIKKERKCKRCGDKVDDDLAQTVNMMTMNGGLLPGGLSMGLNNNGFLRQKGAFGNKI